MHFTNPESRIQPDNSPEMRFNNMYLDLMNLPVGGDVEVDAKRRIHRELVAIAGEILKEGDRKKALEAAHKGLEQSLSDESNGDEKYTV